MIFEHAIESIVVLCAGRSLRFSGGPKCLAPAGGTPMLAHVIEPFRPYCKKWVFVTAPGDIAVKRFILSMDIESEIVIQPDPIGMTDATLRGAARAGRRFGLLLGDCFIRGAFDAEKAFENAAGVWAAAAARDISENYGVEVREGMITRAEEKPRDTAGLLCGMGMYFLTSDFAAFLARENEARGGALHFTSALDQWANSGEALAALPFDGFYRNVNTSEDLAAVENFLNAGKT